MSEGSYITCWDGRTPSGGSLSNEGAPALIDRAKQYFRDMREVDGLVVRRQPSDSKGSARFARSLTEQQAED